MTTSRPTSAPRMRSAVPSDAVEVLDDVMQRLFATGIGLQVLADRELDADAADQLRRHIAELDEAIADIRGQLFPPGPERSIAHRHRGVDHGLDPASVPVSAGVGSVVS